MTYRGMFSEEEYAEVRRFFRDEAPTPLRRVGNVLVKDESLRYGLGAFKAVGVSYALARLEIPSGSMLVCASAGNHGRAVAHVGRARGFRVRVYMSASTPSASQERIRAEGAEVVLVNGTYDDAVARARDDGGVIISDTAWPGYEDVPRLIMAGYTHICDEAEKQWSAPPAEVFVQAGVGALAGAVVSWFCHQFGDKKPKLTIVEVSRAGVPAGRTAGVSPARRPDGGGTGAATTTRLPSIMSGLDCDEPSSLAVSVLKQGADDFVTVNDDQARDAMARLAAAGISSGPSGAAGYAGVIARPPDGTVFVINTEGA